jgi:predicted dehydrogenase
MNAKVKWGVLGTAHIAVTKVIPAMQRGDWCEVVAIASRDFNKSKQAARDLGIPKAYDSYEELLADAEVEAVYIPLPNHLHVEWSIKSAEAGRHVLCEKPIALSMCEAKQLLAARNRTGMKIEEAFMVRTHRQWIAARDLIGSGRIGDVRSMMGHFSYFNADRTNIRNVIEYGGGGLMDIGCYLINTSRFIFGAEPRRVIGVMERDAETGIDLLTSAILDYPAGQCIFTCGTQLVPYQRVHIFGARGRIEIEIPFNAPPDRPCRIFVDDGSDVADRSAETIELDPVNQYTIQGDLFSKAIREKTEVAVPLEDSIKNMAVIEAVFRSAESGRWENPLS